MNLDFILSLNLFMISMMFLILNKKHMLMILISLEFLMISLIYNMFMIMVILNFNIYLILIMMVMMVCEGVLGITLMIFLVRLSGNDYLISMNLLKW